MKYINIHIYIYIYIYIYTYICPNAGDIAFYGCSENMRTRNFTVFYCICYNFWTTHSRFFLTTKGK